MSECSLPLPCVDCMVAESSPDLLKAAWTLSSATTLDEAKVVPDPPSLWAAAIMDVFHVSDHKMGRAVDIVTTLTSYTYTDTEEE